MIRSANTTIAVVGAGTMGHGIAQLCASSGFHVILYDVSEELTGNAIQQIRKNMESLVAKGKISGEAMSEVMSRIATTTESSQVVAEIIIEAVVEDLQVKQRIFEALEATNDDTTILLTNTSSIPVTAIGQNLRRAERFAGLHFFNPPVTMKLVEVIQGPSTSQSVVKTLMDFAAKLNKHAVLAKDSPGFIVNRVARHFYLEALKALEDDEADLETIDSLMRSAGFRMGPFELMDLIGVDINLAVTKSIYNGFNQVTRFKPSHIQETMVSAGKIGKKSGEGFYTYKS